MNTTVWYHPILDQIGIMTWVPEYPLWCHFENGEDGGGIKVANFISEGWIRIGKC